MAVMNDARPIGLRDYVRANGFHVVHVIIPLDGGPVKIGITEEPVQRLGTMQASHYQERAFHRFWWLPGVAVASRIEEAFKRQFADGSSPTSTFVASGSE
jgi:hypothetical protein